MTLIDGSTVPSIVASLIAAVIFAVALYLSRSTLIRWAQRAFPALESRTPHINFETQSKQTKVDWTTSVTISNAGDEPAYNVYIFAVERSPVDGNFTIRSLGGRNVRRAVLGVRDTLLFGNIGLMFDGCNVTHEEQLWVEFDNSARVKFRMVVLPVSARGDSERTIPPKVIKERLERLPDLVMTGGSTEWRRLQRGRSAKTKV